MAAEGAGRPRRNLWPEVVAVLFVAACLLGWARGRALVPATPTPTPALGVSIALPGERFPDGAAFLAAGDEFHLQPALGTTPLATARARVVAVATGTRTAVLVDVEPAAAAAIQALLPDRRLVLQYVELTPTPTSALP